MNRCLIVDDSSIIRKVTRHFLESMRYTVSEAENGREALDLCRQLLPPDVILLDWHLPVLGAMDFLARLRATSAGRRPFVIYCTTENDAEDITRAFAVGADDYLLKPYDRATLLAKFTQISAAA